jgi:hypothetical protein
MDTNNQIPTTRAWCIGPNCEWSGPWEQAIPYEEAEGPGRCCPRCKSASVMPVQSEPTKKNTLSDRLILAFLEPALIATDWREKWKGVNRAAGVIAGWAQSEFLDGHYQNAPLCYAGGVEAAEGLVVEIESRFNGTPAHAQLTDGLRKRVAEILVLMS